MGMPLLGVNIDHIATIRQARYRGGAAEGIGEPDPVFGAAEAELGGADIITVHLREDRRHIQDRDVHRLRECLGSGTRLNLEMGATDEMVGIALKVKPQMCTLVPEGRQEVTTEGGLNVAGAAARMKDVVAKLNGAGIVVSAFIDAETKQIEAAKGAGFGACEIHTGPFAAAFAKSGGDLTLGTLSAEHQKVADAGHRIRAMAMRFNAGHALNYRNVGMIARLPGMAELHIGHAIVCRAVWVGMREAVREMKRVMEK